MATRLTETLLADMHRYLNGQMTAIEIRRFEDELEKNQELREELTLEKELRYSLNEDSDYSIFKNDAEVDKLKTKLRSSEYQNLSNAIRNAEKEYVSEQTTTKKPRTFYKYYAVAAAVILFVSIYFSQMNPSLDSYYDTYADWNNLPSFVEKGQNEDTFTKGYIAFKNKNYDKAVSYFSSIDKTHELYPYGLIYLGASYDLLDQNENALTTFQKLISTDTFHENTKGYWYTALIYLKIKDKEKAISALEKVLEKEQNYKYQEAKEILKKIQ